MCLSRFKHQTTFQVITLCNSSWWVMLLGSGVNQWVFNTHPYKSIKLKQHVRTDTSLFTRIITYFSNRLHMYILSNSISIELSSFSLSYARQSLLSSICSPPQKGTLAHTFHRTLTHCCWHMVPDLEIMKFSSRARLTSFPFVVFFANPILAAVLSPGKGEYKSKVPKGWILCLFFCC